VADTVIRQDWERGGVVWYYCWLGLMVYITFTIHSKLNLSAPSSDLSASSKMSTSAKSAS